MPIERCNKCGKAFMSKAEVKRHKMWEHPVPISPFEERPSAGRDVNPEDLHRLTSDVMVGGNDIAIGRQRRKAPYL